MSTDSVKNIVHIEKDDVDEVIETSGSNSDEYNDSGIVTIVAHPITIALSTDIELQPVTSKNIEVCHPCTTDDTSVKTRANGKEIETRERNCDSALDSIHSYSALPSSDSEILPIKHMTNSESSNQNHCEISSAVAIERSDSSVILISPHHSTLETSSPFESSNNNANFESVPKLTKDEVTNTESTNNSQNVNFMYTDFKNINSNLTLSSVSLDDQSSTKTVLNKSPHSRSAENISILDQQDKSLNASEKNLNTEKILSEFANQKAKVVAVQKIPETPTNLDIQYTRIPKEILSQDIGSIVKNVHGIFSSMSGSLKNAYTHRTYTQKPIKTVKPIPNGKIMSDIFEDESTEKHEITNDSLESGLNSNAECVKPGQESVEQESDDNKDILRVQVESLEKVLAEQRRENVSLRERVKQQADKLQEKDHTYKDLENKLDMMIKRIEQAEREKDAAVMRYAGVECSRIEAKRATDLAVKNEKAALAEVELLNNKLKSAHAEKQRICQLYDDKCHELQNSEREMLKVRDDTRELEGRLKWTQSKLRMEMDAYKESSERAEKLSQQVTELEAAKEAAMVNAAESTKAKQLESDLKESQAALILCAHEKEELERRVSSVSSLLDTCTRERDAATACLARTTAEIEQLKISNMRLEEEAAELAALRAQAALADTLGAQLHRETERASQAEEALSVERALAETCARREAAALEHAARLTAQHVAQRAAAHHHEAKAQALSADNTSLRERVAALEEQGALLQATLAEQTDRRHKENKVLARKVAELTEEVAEANKKLEWEKGEIGVLKKKHASAIKELNRELQRALKRCEQLEAKLPPPDATSTRTGSISSLSSAESAPHEDRLQNGHTDVPDIQAVEPDRQALIERIVSLQRGAARRAERCEFLEEHTRQLTGELRAKSRLLRSLLADLPAGAVASRDRDLNKKEIARLGGGAMAAVWGGDPAGMSLELSLEMTSRLQAVLEDTLLKNITLKENMDTLGAEISRLKEQAKNNADFK